MGYILVFVNLSENIKENVCFCNAAGILGKEGRQAARSADFALAKFDFLRKAILVHGHFYYVRLANLANFFFYKNLVLVFPQLLFCFYNTFSSQVRDLYFTNT